MRTIVKTKAYEAPPDEVFNCLDDLSVTGMHMTESSMPMMGGKLNLEFLSKHKKGLHTKYRWTGKVLWMPMDFTVLVTDWVKGKEKTWETIGMAKVILYSWFRMHISVDKKEGKSIASLSISYEKPKGLFGRVLSFFLGGWYGRWCLKNMLNDTERRLQSKESLLIKMM